jgi:hypothetical protein
MSRLGKRGSGEEQDGGTHEGGIETVTQWGKRKRGGDQRIVYRNKTFKAISKGLSGIFRPALGPPRVCYNGFHRVLPSLLHY